MAGINANGGVSAPRATNPPVPLGRGTAQPASPHGAKIVKVKAHTRVIRPKAVAKTAPKAPVDPYAAPVNAAAGLKYGPEIQAVNQQLQGSQYNQVRAGNWYSDYQNSLKASQAQQNQAAQNVAQALSQTFGAQTPLQTGNPQADQLAQQASQSRGYLGQSTAGTQSQMALDTANRFATGLVPSAQLQGEQAQQNEVNRQGQLKQQRGDLLSQEGEYKTTLKGQLQAADQTARTNQQKIQMAAAIAQGKLDLASQIAQNITLPNTQSQIKTRSQGVRLKRQQQSDTRNQHQVDNAIKVNNLALKAYQLAHPELRNKSGTALAQKYQQGVDRGEAVLRLLHGTPPAKDSTGQVTKPNPFYNLNASQLRASRQHLIDILQASAKAGHLTKEQATKAVDTFIKNQAQGNGNNLGQIVTGLLHKLSGGK